MANILNEALLGNEKLEYRVVPRKQNSRAVRCPHFKHAIHILCMYNEYTIYFLKWSGAILLCHALGSTESSNSI